jgi:hypothetical protein
MQYMAASARSPIRRAFAYEVNHVADLVRSLHLGEVSAILDPDRLRWIQSKLP